MKQQFTAFLLVLALLLAGTAKADEGMWIPMLLKKYNIGEMQEKGFKLTAEDIYSVNQASMKDAVMIFNGGCTAELISDEGLLITNHHCGYSAIQSHSTVENDYLSDGYWAMSRGEELSNPGMTVTFLVRMEDVTQQALDGVTEEMTEAERQKTVDTNIARVKEKATANNNYGARVEPFYFGNQYFLFVNKTYKDIRLVGAPPSAVGKFGGDTDNWMWPRHTGDFSLFRIYANEENEPVEYSADNKPYTPKKHFKISIEGYKPGDFTMVFGYPGSTDQYLTSWGLDMESYQELPHRIKLRGAKLDVIKKAMKADKKIRIQYASKQSRISNAWKKWQGILRGLDRLDALEQKRELQENFRNWVDKRSKRSEQYGGLLDNYHAIYKEMAPYNLAYSYFVESGYYMDFYSFARGISNLMSESADKALTEEVQDKLQKKASNFFKDYHLPTDKKVFTRVMQLYADSMPEKFRPASLNKAIKTHDDNMQAYADSFYAHSTLLQQDTLMQLLKTGSEEAVSAILNGPAIQLYKDLNALYGIRIAPHLQNYQRKIDSLNRTWIKGLKAMQEDKTFWPDANFTLRVAYGEVKGYKPKNAVEYRHYTTMEGVMEKNDPDTYEYDVPEKLISLYRDKDFGPYAEDGQMHVCFIASNHTSGGNSGSPVINGDGELIGVNFDRNWEGTMSDMMYDPSQCRNITLDIRYALFIIDKFAGADHLIEEMDIVE